MDLGDDVAGDPDDAPAPDAAVGPRRWTPSRVATWFAVPLFVVTSGLLVAASVAGLYVRPAADDWCIAANMKNGGIAGVVHYFYDQVNGRAANAVIAGAVYSSGLNGSRVLPGLIALSMALGLFLLIRAVARRAGWTVPALLTAGVAAGLTAIVLFAGDVVYQVFFWTAGSVSHTLPAILAVWAVLGLLAASGSARAWARPAALVGAALVAFTIGSLSEAFLAVGCVYAAVALVLGIVGLRRHHSWFLLLSAVTWLAGSVVGFAVEYFAPGRQLRSARVHEVSTFSYPGLRNSVHQWLWVWERVLRQPAYYGAVALGVAFGLAVGAVRVRDRDVDAGPEPVRRRGLVRAAGLLLPLTIIWVASFAVIVELRIAYGHVGWRYERVWTNFLVPTVLTAALYGAMLGRAVRLRARRGRVDLRPVLIVVSILSGLAAVGLLVPRKVHLSQQIVRRAAPWDAENALVLREASRGAVVVEFTPHRIAGLSEPFTYRMYAEDWVAHCVSRYYGIHRLRPAPSWLRSPASAEYRGVPRP